MSDFIELLQYFEKYALTKIKIEQEYSSLADIVWVIVGCYTI